MREYIYYGHICGSLVRVAGAGHLLAAITEGCGASFRWAAYCIVLRCIVLYRTVKHLLAAIIGISRWCSPIAVHFMLDSRHLHSRA